MTRVGHCRGRITITGSATYCLHSGFFLSGFAFFGTSSYVFWTMPVNCQRTAKAREQKSLPTQ
jgi:hypothetical protein